VLNAGLLRRIGRVFGGLPGRALRAWAGSAQLAGQPEQAQRLYEQSLTIFRALGDDQGIAILTYRLGLLALELGHPGRARPLLEQSRAAFEAIGSRRGQAQTIGAFGSLAHAEGNTALAATLYQHSATLAGQIGRTWWQARMLTKLADVALADEQHQDVTRWARQALLLARQIGNRQTIVYALAQLAAAAAAKNDRWRAGRLWGAIEADEARAPIGIWESAREPLAYRVLGLATPELERGLQQGRCFSLDEAVVDALEADPLNTPDPEHDGPAAARLADQKDCSGRWWLPAIGLPRSSRSAGVCASPCRVPATERDDPRWWKGSPQR
jgi:tetratricopeptide (TPR) repeat protein